MQKEEGQLSAKSEEWGEEQWGWLAAGPASLQAALSCAEISHQAQPMLAPAWWMLSFIQGSVARGEKVSFSSCCVIPLDKSQIDRVIRHQRSLPVVGSFYYVPFQETKAAARVKCYGKKKTILFSQLHNHALLRGNANIRNEARLPSISLAAWQSGERKTPSAVSFLGNC